MDKNDKKLLKEVINEYNDGNNEEYVDVLRKVIYTYLRAFVSFGPNHRITKEVKEIWEEYKSNHNAEYGYQQLLIKNYKLMHYSEALDFLDLLQDYDEQSVKYYRESFNDIVDACDTKVEFRANHKPKKFKALADERQILLSYRGLTLSREEIIDFLGYPQEFWDYLKPRMREVDPWVEENKYFWKTFLKFDDNKILCDMRVCVPGIVNIQTACVNVHEFKHAYDMYKLLGQEVDEENPKYEDDARRMEKIFCDEYVLKKKI